MKSANARILASAKTFIRKEKGSVAMMTAASMVAITGFAALAVDGAHLYETSNQLQTTADAVALAAVTQLPNPVKVGSIANAIAARNMPPANHGDVLPDADIVMGSWDDGTRIFTPNASPPNAVGVTTRKTEANGNPALTFFGNVLGFRKVDLTAQAVATLGHGPSCLVVLEPTEPAILVNANSTVSANGCTIQVNSTHAEAVTTNSGSKVITDGMNIVGGYAGENFTPEPYTGVSPMTDPLIGLQPPPTANDPCNYNDFTVTGTTTLFPGVYCKGITISSGAHGKLDPGIYVLRDGGLMVSSNSSVEGSNVGIYLTGPSAVVTMSSDSHSVLGGPTSGPMAGILFFQDRNSQSGQDHTLNSNSGSIIEGTVYLPVGDVVLNSNSALGENSPYSSIVALTFTVNSGSTAVLNSNYEASEVPLPKSLAKKRNRLVQ